MSTFTSEEDARRFIEALEEVPAGALSDPDTADRLRAEEMQMFAQAQL